MITPILTTIDGQSTDTQRSVYLPASTWHQLRWSQGNFSFVSSHTGPSTIAVTGVQFTDMVMFGRAGGIVFMAPLLQYVMGEHASTMAAFHGRWSNVRQVHGCVARRLSAATGVQVHCIRYLPTLHALWRICPLLEALPNSPPLSHQRR